jgi:hypothetical protein
MVAMAGMSMAVTVYLLKSVTKYKKKRAGEDFGEQFLVGCLITDKWIGGFVEGFSFLGCDIVSAYWTT